MSTRSFYGFIKDKKLKTNYCHMGGYPSGLGIDFINTLTSLPLEDIIEFAAITKSTKRDNAKVPVNEIKNFIAAYDDLILKIKKDIDEVSNVDLKSYYMEELEGVKLKKENMLNVSVPSPQVYDSLRPLQNHPDIVIKNKIGILVDATHHWDVEWSYIVNFDKNRLEVRSHEFNKDITFAKRPITCAVPLKYIFNCESKNEWMKKRIFDVFSDSNTYHHEIESLSQEIKILLDAEFLTEKTKKLLIKKSQKIL